MFSIPIDEREVIPYLYEYVNKAIETELRHFFLEEDGYDKITADEKDILVNCYIMQSDIDSVDREAVMWLFDDYCTISDGFTEIKHFLSDYSLSLCRMDGYLTEEDAAFMAHIKSGDFILRKFVQLVKLVKSKDEYTPDLFMEALLYLIAKNAREDDTCQYDKKEEMLEQYFKTRYIGVDDDSLKDVMAYVREGKVDDAAMSRIEEYEIDFLDAAKQAVKNLASIYEAEMNFQIGWLFWDSDYKCLLEGDIETLTEILFLDGTYSDFDMRMIYVSVGCPVPYTMEKVLYIKNDILLAEEEGEDDEYDEDDIDEDDEDEDDCEDSDDDTKNWPDVIF